MKKYLGKGASINGGKIRFATDLTFYLSFCSLLLGFL
jgi:hypothetical protein